MLPGEKLFCTERSLNVTNNVVYFAIFKDIPENLRTVKHFQNEFYYGLESSVKQWKIASEIY